MSKYYLLAGEPSGDIHGANLVSEIANLDSNAEFRGFGGDHMKAKGVEIIQHYKDIAFMGFKEVLLNLKTLSKAITLCKHDLLNHKPDVLILIDYPGFNLRIAQFAKTLDIKVVYYISPQIWAWKAKRIKKIRKYIDKMISILPFEEEFYKKYNFPIDYVGHPLLDHIKSFVPNPEFVNQHNPTNQKLIAVLPGSRQQEISKILPVILTVCKTYPEYKFLIAGTSSVDKHLYNSIDSIQNAELIIDDSYNILHFADAGIVKSGTSTLEASLFDLPFVVVYKTTGITYCISKALIKIKFIALANLVMDREIVKELIQHDFTMNTVSKELISLLEDEEYRSKIISNFQLIKSRLGHEGASKGAAKLIFSFTLKN